MKLFSFLAACLLTIAGFSAEANIPLVHFEDASPEHAEFLTQLAMRANATYGYRTVTDEEARHVFEVTEEHFNNGIIRIMKGPSGIMGFYGLVLSRTKNGKELNLLSHLFLAPKYIGNGHGRTLFLEAMRVAKEELHWEALQWESDPNAAGFYQKMGAKKIGENPCPLDPNQRAPVFVYTLE